MHVVEWVLGSSSRMNFLFYACMLQIWNFNCILERIAYMFNEYLTTIILNAEHSR